MSSPNAKDRISLCLFTYQDGRRCGTPRISSHPPLLLLPRPKRSPGPLRRNTRQRPGLLLFRRLPLRLRSQHRAEPPHSRCHPRRNKAPPRPHRRLHDANAPAVHPPRPGRIHQRLQHRRLAQIHPQLRQLQPRLPLPAPPQPTRTSSTRLVRAATAPANPTGPNPTPSSDSPAPSRSAD